MSDLKDYFETIQDTCRTLNPSTGQIAISSTTDGSQINNTDYSYDYSPFINGPISCKEDILKAIAVQSIDTLENIVEFMKRELLARSLGKSFLNMTSHVGEELLALWLIDANIALDIVSDILAGKQLEDQISETPNK